MVGFLWRSTSEVQVIRAFTFRLSCQQIKEVKLAKKTVSFNLPEHI